MYLTTTGDGRERRDPYGFTFAPAPFPYLKAVLKMMNHFKWKRFAIVYDLLETGGFYVKVRIQFRCQLKSVFHRSEDKCLHQFVVYPAQLSNLFFMLPLSDISVFSLTFELVANLPLMIFVLSRKNAFTKATDYAIFGVFFFFGGGGFGFLLLLGILNFNFCE